MNLQHLIDHFWEVLVLTATRGPLMVPFWAAVALLVVLITRRRVLTYVCRIFGVDDPEVQRAIVARIDVPVQFLLVILATAPFVRLIPNQTGLFIRKCAEFLAPLLAIHVFIQATYFVVFRWYFEHKKNRKIPSVLFVVVLSLIYAGVILLLLEWIFRLSVLPLLATSTVVTAVLGLALQDTLRNIFAGLTVSLEQSFRQGDWVLFRQDANNRLVGEIIEIGWRSTKIRTVNNNYIIIPNAQFTSNELINYNSPSPVHAKEISFPVSLKADPKKLRPALERLAAKVNGVLEKPVPQVRAVEMRADAVVYQLRFWVDHFENREKITAEVIEAVWQKLVQENALPSCDGALSEAEAT